MRSTGLAYVLWLFLGVLGVHRFYCGRVGTGILWLFTGGLCGVGWLIDVFLIPGMVDEANRESRSYRRRDDPLFPQTGTVSGPSPPPIATPMPPERNVSGIAEGHRVVFCTRCGGPMQVPVGSAGRAYACPVCHTVLEVPT